MVIMTLWNIRVMPLKWGTTLFEDNSFRLVSHSIFQKIKCVLFGGVLGSVFCVVLFCKMQHALGMAFFSGVFPIGFSIGLGKKYMLQLSKIKKTLHQTTPKKKCLSKWGLKYKIDRHRWGVLSLALQTTSHICTQTSQWRSTIEKFRFYTVTL